MIYGISHFTFIVKDLDKATKFFEEIFEAEVVYSNFILEHWKQDFFAIKKNLWTKFN